MIIYINRQTIVYDVFVFLFTLYSTADFYSRCAYLKVVYHLFPLLAPLVLKFFNIGCVTVPLDLKVRTSARHIRRVLLS